MSDLLCNHLRRDLKDAYEGVMMACPSCRVYAVVHEDSLTLHKAGDSRRLVRARVPWQTKRESNSAQRWSMRHAERRPDRRGDYQRGQWASRADHRM